LISLAGALFFARHALVFVLLAGTCFVLGRRLLRNVDCGGLGEEVATCTGMGLGAGSLALFGIGLLGFLTAPVVAAGFLLIHAACLGTWRKIVRRARLARARATGGPEVFAWLPAALALVLIAALSCYPPTGFDATLYHLPYARAFASSHRIVSLPARRFPVFPQLTEMLFSAMLLLADDTGAQGVELLALAACLAALSGWARAKSGPAAGVWAASAWIGCPAVALLAASAYVDLGFSLFAILSFFAWERWREEGRGEWIAVSAVFAGFSAGTKYHGLFVAALLGAMTLWVCVRRRRGATPFGLFFAASVAVSSPWYVRNFLATGNPLFPFFPRIFGSSPYSLALDAVTAGGTARVDTTMTLLRAAKEWSWAPLRVARALTGVPGLSGQTPLSPFLIPLAAVAAAAALRNAAVRRALLFSAVYAVACGGAEIRFLLPAAALIAYAGSVAIGRFTEGRAPGSIAVRTAIAAALILPGAVWTAHRIAQLGPIPVRPGERDAYLRRVLPPYAAIEYLNRSRGSAYTVYAVGAENLAYFADGNYLGDWFGPFSYSRIYGRPNGDPEALDRNLRRIGAGYLLIDRGRWPAGVRDDEAFRRHFRERLRGTGFVLYERTD
jgi:hypothetical protein